MILTVSRVRFGVAMTEMAAFCGLLVRGEEKLTSWVEKDEGGRACRKRRRGSTKRIERALGPASARPLFWRGFHIGSRQF